MNAAGYVRVSTNGQSVEAQRHALRRAARARGDRVTRWFVEKVSAATLDRAELGRLRTAVRCGNVRKLYVFRLDRLTRTGVRDTLLLLDEFRRGGCVVVNIADGFELGGPFEDVFVTLFSWAAKCERDALGERISAARARARARGEPWGRPRRVVDVPRARELAKTKSIREVARDLKIPRATLARALRA